ncbi:MAG: damage-control phosphatase ARMT1 family protein [Actinophytocola sp.]|uniref:damage-control phosphatase ARMT1 family protein n=1 Tax=Actinophytocola sp. TaxID=1872138 RepID=UPI003D6A6EDB
MPDAPEIVSSEPGSFPWSVLHDRHPALIAKVRDGLPYPPEHRRALDDLGREITGVLRPLPDSAPDHDLWADRGLGHLGRGWYDVPFLWAESYFYRRLLEAVGYFAPGPWRGVDPFEPFKSAELATPEMTADLAALDEPPADRNAALVAASVWGNRADLGFRISARGPEAEPGALVADQSALLWHLLDDQLDDDGPGTVCLVADNAGRELVPDLVLADQLLETGRARTIALHVKAYPYYVSDATTADVTAALRRLLGAPGEAARIGHRLWEAMTGGTLTVHAHPFSVAPWSYDRMPADLAAEFAAATVTIMKGDLNYRRLVGDRAWDPLTPFEAATDYFPGPVAALRTLKSDVVVGLSTEVLSHLDTTEKTWRTNGNHALVQVRR